MQAKDDSLKRWEQSSIDNKIWQYFNTHISKKIIFEAIEKKSTLEDLYFQLALNRTKCELIKDYVKKHNITEISDENLDLLAAHLINWPPVKFFEKLPKSNDFFTFHYDFRGGMEPLTTFELWGQRVEEFTWSRLNHAHDPRKRIIAGVSSFLSYNNGYKWITELEHKSGFSLGKADGDLQEMIETTNLFEYFKTASHLVYALSNSPPTWRGSASISTWIIDTVGAKKFDFSQSIRPSLFDWAAFYESPEQYNSFFVISATVEYIKSLHVYPEIEVFAEEMRIKLVKNPNGNEEIQERKELWDRLKTIIQNILASQSALTLSQKQINGLKDLSNGHLEFRKISDLAIEIGKKLSATKRDYALGLTGLTLEERRYLLKLNKFKLTARDDFLDTYSDKKAEQEANLLWADVEYLAKNLILPLLNQHKITDKYRQKKDLYERARQSSLVSKGCIDPESYDKYAYLEHCMISAGLEDIIQAALRNGLKINELNQLFNGGDDLSKEQLLLLCSTAALLLYQNNYSIKDFFGNTPEIITINLLIHTLQFHYKLSSNSADLQMVKLYLEQFCPASRSTVYLNVLQGYCVITSDTTMEVMKTNIQNMDVFYKNLIVEAKKAIPVAQVKGHQESPDAFFSTKPQINDNSFNVNKELDSPDDSLPNKTIL